MKLRRELVRNKDISFQESSRTGGRKCVGSCILTRGGRRPTRGTEWSWDRTDLKDTWELGPPGHGVGHAFLSLSARDILG